MNYKSIAFVIFFIIIHLGLFIYGIYMQINDLEMEDMNRFGPALYLSRASAIVLALDMSILLFPVCRNIIRIIRTTFLNKIIPFDEHILFHKMTAYSLLIFTIIHVNGHYTNMFKLQTLNSALTPLYLHYRSYAGVSGHLMLLIMFMMFTAAALKVRKMKFEVFWFVHHLYIPFYVAYFVHALGCMMKSSVDGQCKGYYSRYYMLPGLIAFIIERIIREWRARQETAITKVNFHPGNTMEIRFEKPSFMYKPGQYLFLNVPEISYFQWHPFTISSCPDQSFISIHFRCDGDWTMQLKNQFQETNLKYTQFPRICIDGPFGAPTVDVFQYEVVTLISSGIGITPFASILKSIWFAHIQKKPMKLRKIFFIWVYRDQKEMSWLDGLLRRMKFSLPNDFIKIHIYFTGEMSMNDANNFKWLNYTDDLQSIDNQTISQFQFNQALGRPNWQNIFAEFRQYGNGTHPQTSKLKFGVFFCGNKPLGDYLGNICNTNSDNYIQFIYHREYFE